MSALNIIRGPDGLAILSDGAAYNTDGVVQGFMSKLMTFAHMPAVVGLCGPLALLPELYKVAFQCSSFDELLSAAGEAASHWRDCGEFSLVIAGYSRARDAFEIYVVPGYDDHAFVGLPAFALIRVSGNYVLPNPFPEIAREIGWDMPARDDLDAERDGLQLMECQRRDTSLGHSVVGGFVEQTVVTRTGISSQVIKWWPDEIGRKIEPERDDTATHSEVIDMLATAKFASADAANGHDCSLTFSRGFPGGPAGGFLQDFRQRREVKINMALPDIRRQILRGDLGGAMQKMRELEVEPGFQRFIIRTTLNPATRVSGRSLREFWLHSSDSQRERFERARQ